MRIPRALLIALVLVSPSFAAAEGGAGKIKLPPGLKDPGRLRLIDVFELEWASDPQISPDGEAIVYVRNFMDVMSDRRRSNLWMVRADGSDHRPLTTGLANDSSPRWSPDGKRLLYASSSDRTPAAAAPSSTCAGWTAARPPA